MKNENEIDELFKRSLAEREIPFNELHWEKMEDKLDAARSRRLVPIWLKTAAGIAAAVLIVLLFVLPEKQNVIQEHKIKKQSGNQQHPSVLQPASEIDRTLTVKAVVAAHTAGKRLRSSGKSVDESGSGVQLPQLVSPLAPVQLAEQFASIIIDKTHLVTRLPAQTSTFTKKQVESTVKIGSPFVLSIIAAPDVSSSPKNLSAKLSKNIGLLGSYAVSKRLSFTTGVVYAIKRYDYGGDSPGKYGKLSNSWKIDADCRVLDIPLNVNYQLFSKGNNAMSINTGISSYIMLNEKYKQIDNGGAGAPKISVSEIVNRNQHVFGVANLSISFNRKVSSNFNIGIQPFLKLPLTGLGEYDTRLRSAGVAVSLNINLLKRADKN